MTALLKALCIVMLLPAVIVACGETTDSAPAHELTGTTMGTTFSVTLLDPDNEFVGSALQEDIETLLTNLNGSLSTYRPDSEISRFNSSASTDWFPVSRPFCEVVADALAISKLTAGAFDVTVGPVVNLWGFGSAGTISVPPAGEDIENALRSVGYQRLHTDCIAPAIRKEIASLFVDLSAYAKGFAVDQIANLLDSRGVTNYLVEIGGELRLRGSNARGTAWTIGIESPALAHRQVRKVLELTDVAVATSGDYRNYFESDGALYSHTIDPRTGYPVTHAGASVTVVAHSAAEADAMATALMVLGPAHGLDLAEREHIAALFQLRADEGIEERASEPFVALLAGS